MNRIVGQRDHHDAVLNAGVEKARTAPPGSNPPLSGKSDPDVVALVASIVALAEDNTDEPRAGGPAANDPERRAWRARDLAIVVLGCMEPRLRPVYL